jgi:hypothetical protein
VSVKAGMPVAVQGAANTPPEQAIAASVAVSVRNVDGFILVLEMNCVIG